MACQSPLFRIGRDVTKLISKILHIANAVLVESRLSDFPAKLSAPAMRKAAFDALGTTLDGLAGRRSQQNMQVFGHDHEPMQKIAALVAIME
jgi:hypothetical protein